MTSTETTRREDAHSAQMPSTVAGSRAGRILRRVTPWWPIATLVALTSGVFWPVLVGGKSFSVVPSFQTATYPWASLATDLRFKWPQSDQAESSYPWSAFIGRTLREGGVPFWDPSSFGGGSPLFSNGLSAVLYPPQVLLRATFSAATAHDLFVILHIFLAGAFTLLLLRRLGVSRLGGTVGAVSWMFGSCTMAWVQLEMMTPYFALLPLGLYCVDRAVRGRSWPWVVIAGWALGLELISGNLLIMWLAFLTALAYGAVLALVDVIGEGFTFRRAATAMGRLGLISLLAGCGAAIVAIPTYLTLRDAGRVPFTYEELQQQFLMPWSTFKYLWTAPVLPLGPLQMQQMVWYGLAPLLFAILGFAFDHGRAAWLGRASIVVAGGIAVGTPLTWVAYNFVPGFDSLQPYARLMFVVGFGICLLAGAGVDVLASVLRRLRTRFVRRLRPGHTVVRLAALVGGLSLVSWAAFPLIGYAMRINPEFVEAATHPQYPDTPVINTLRTADSAAPWPGLVMPVSVTRRDGGQPLSPLIGATAMVTGISTFGGYDSSAPTRTSAVVKLMTGVPLASAVKTGSSYVHPVFVSTDVRWDLLLNYGVEYVYASPKMADGDSGNWGSLGDPGKLQRLYDGPDGRLYKVPHSDSGPYVTGSQSVVNDSASALRLFTSADYDPRKKVVLERADLAGKQLLPIQSGAPQITRFAPTRTNNSINVQVTSDRRGWLVLPTNYDQGWSAQVDGKDVPIVHANYSRMAVQIPAGRSTVQLKYRPAGFYVGVGLLLTALLVSAVILARVAMRRSPRLTGLLRGRPAVDRARSVRFLRHHRMADDD